MPSPEIGAPEKVDIVIAEYDPAWPHRFEVERTRIIDALGGRALRIDHVGSTAVPGLAAKPIIDIDLAVADSADEDGYVPDLVAVGYALRVREPDWEEHRMLRTAAHDVHLHVFSPGSNENARHLLLRDRLRRTPKRTASSTQRPSGASLRRLAHHAALRGREDRSGRRRCSPAPAGAPSPTASPFATTGIGPLTCEYAFRPWAANLSSASTR